MTTEPSSWPKQLQEKGLAFKNRVDSPAMFRAYMFAKMPSLGITTAYIEEIDVEACRVRLPFGWRTRDLFGRVSTSAVLAAAEAASVSLLVLNIRNQGASLVPVVKGVKMVCLRDAREALTLECVDGQAHAALVADVHARQLAGSKPLMIEAKDAASGEVTHTVEITWEMVPK